MKASFHARFASEGAKVLTEQEWKNRHMKHGENIQNYITDILKLGHRVEATSQDKTSRFIAGLLPSIKQQVLIHAPENLQ